MKGCDFLWYDEVAPLPAMHPWNWNAISHAAMIRAANLDELEPKPVRQELGGWSWDASKLDLVTVSPDGQSATFAMRHPIIGLGAVSRSAGARTGRSRIWWNGYALSIGP